MLTIASALLNSSHLFHPPPNLLPSGNHEFVLFIYRSDSDFSLFIQFFLLRAKDEYIVFTCIKELTLILKAAGPTVLFEMATKSKREAQHPHLLLEKDGRLCSRPLKSSSAPTPTLVLTL